MNDIYSKVNKTATCWNWTGGKSKGYGMLRWNGKMKPAPRVIFELERHPIPNNLFCDHLCRNRACVNPDHIEIVSNKVNILRGISQSAINARKTHCKNGHPFGGANLHILPNGNRRCRACNLASWHRRKKLTDE